ncbi:MAG TPA: triose-phosphate isomerase [Acidimicrobiales bacterium]|nr:triose-phosphate isomerase [Acidimicrobiales bacterium]
MPEASRKPLISGNWKMHLNHFEALQTVQKLHYKLTKADFDAVDVSVHPPFTDLRTVQTAIESDHMSLILGAQSCHWEEKGAFTGEVAPGMLAKLQVRYVIVGHSERRQLFGETDEQVNAKVRAVLANTMTPIMCVGETLEEREAGETEGKVLSQLRAGLARVDRAAVAKMVVAYEPIWAIGTGRTATPADAQAVCAAIRAEAGSIAGTEAAAAVRIQYGGSVKAINIAELMAERDIDGVLVGGASLDPDEFAAIVQYRLR